MKMIVQHVFIRSTDEVDSLIENRILALQPRIEIEEARVCLEKRKEQSPAYQVAVHLVTPGPDLVSEARDHTIRAAIDKAMAKLENKIGERKQKRSRRVKSNASKSAVLRSGRIV